MVLAFSNLASPAYYLTEPFWDSNELLQGGEWRGKSKAWTLPMKAEFGTYQLLRAMGVLKIEGIRPIFPQALPDSLYPFAQKKNAKTWA